MFWMTHTAGRIVREVARAERAPTLSTGVDCELDLSLFRNRWFAVSEELREVASKDAVGRARLFAGFTRLRTSSLLLSLPIPRASRVRLGEPSAGLTALPETSAFASC